MQVYTTKQGGIVVEGDEKCAKYYVEWDASGNIVKQSLQIPGTIKIAPVSNIGAQFRKNLHAQIGGVPCGACREEEIRLNGMTPEQVRAEADAIVEGVIARAMASEKWSLKIKAILGNLFAPESVRRVVRECLVDAISSAENYQKQTTP